MEAIEKLKNVTGSINFKIERIKEIEEEIAALKSEMESEKVCIKEMALIVKALAIDIDNEVSNG